MASMNLKLRTLAAMLSAAALLGALSSALPAHAQTAPVATGPTAITPPAPPPPLGPFVSATGVASVAGSADSRTTILSIAVQERASTKDPQAAVKVVQDKQAKIRAALVAAGISAASVQDTDFNIGPYYGGPVAVPAQGQNGVVPPMAAVAPDGAPASIPSPESSSSAVAPAPGVAPAIFPPIPTPYGFMVNASMQVTTSSPDQLALAMRVAVENGATSVNSYGRGGTGTPPDASVLAPAIAQATRQATAMVRASADAAGVTLDAVRSITVQQPQAIYDGGPSPKWQVQVQVTYNVR